MAYFDCKIPVPELTSPPSGGVDYTQMPQLKWKSIPDSGQVLIQISESDSFASHFEEGTARAEAAWYSVHNTLGLGKRYYWRACLKDSNGVQGAWSAASWFDEKLYPPRFEHPTAGAAVDSLRPWFGLNNQWGATVVIQVSQTQDFATLIEEGRTGNTSWAMAKMLANNSRYYCRARMITSAGIESDWCVPVDFLVSLPRPHLAPVVRYHAPSYDFQVGNTAIGDFNGDTRKDVAVLENNKSRVLVYYQNGDGTLGAPVTFTTDLTTRRLAAGDVNSDGFDELVICGDSTTAGSGPLGRIAVFRQDGPSHGLGSPQYYQLACANVDAVAVADMNNDGRQDVVCLGRESAGNGILSFFFQGPGGSLGAEDARGICAVQRYRELHVADMNSDGKNDLVVQSGPLQLAVIKQADPGVFSTSPDFYAVQTSYGSEFYSFSLGDLNGDGRTDIAVSDSGSRYLNRFIQDANGTLTRTTAPPARWQGALEELIADIDGDGLDDILTVYEGDRVCIYFQSAGHGFDSCGFFDLGTGIIGGTNATDALKVADVTGDGVPDIVTTWFDSVFVLARVP